MQITFEPTGEVVTGVGVTVTPQFTNGIGTLVLPTYTVPSGYTPVQTTLTAGSPAAILAGSYSTGYYVRFFAGDAKTLLVTKFKMDDADALVAAAATIESALNAATEAIVLKSNGSLGS